MNPVVRIKINVKMADGQWRYADPVVAGNAKLKPLHALVNGKPQHHPEGVYYLRYMADSGKRIYEKIGEDAQVAMQAQNKRQKMLSAKAAGVLVVEEEKKEDPGVRLSSAAVKYLDEVKNNRRGETHRAYTQAVNLFLQSCHKKYLKEVDREDLLNYMNFLRSRGDEPRTVKNRTCNVVTFLRHHDIESPLKKTDKPKFTEKLVTAYTKEDMDNLLAAADEDEYDLFYFFLCTGAREKEVEFACWGDINYGKKFFEVREKLDLGFLPKDHEEGDVPIPDSLLERLKARRKRYPTGRLIFPTGEGKPEGHMLRILKNLAYDAKLNCGECYDDEGNSCSDEDKTKSANCTKWKLHRFRKTFATRHSDAGVPVRKIQKWLRHADLETTLRYLAGGDDQTPVIRGLVNAAFA